MKMQSYLKIQKIQKMQKIQKIQKIQRLGFVPTSEESVLLSGKAAKLFSAWMRFLAELLRPFYATTFQCPLFISKEILNEAKYLSHFPQQLFVSQGYKSYEYKHSASSRKFITPAACLHIYAWLKEKDLADDSFTALITARCARLENQQWEFPFRMSSFQMTELVVIGSQIVVEQTLYEVQSLLASTFDHFGFHGAFEPGCDAFFLGSDSGSRIIQKLKGLKQEFKVFYGTEKIALASINNHETYFGLHFGINRTNRRPASSCCIAFGLERLTAYSLMAWGDHEKNWPKELQS